MTLPISPEAAPAPLPKGGLFARGMVWSVRLLVAMAALPVWLFIAILLLAYFLPGPQTEDESSGTGIVCELPATVLPGRLTLLYVAGALPWFVLPLRRDELATVFLHSVQGWLLCLVGALGGLWLQGCLVELEGPGTSSGRWLHLAWVAWNTAGLPVLVGVYLAALAFVPLVQQRRKELLSLAGLLWLFGWVGLFGYRVTHGGLELTEDAGQAVFVALLLVLFAGPVFTWWGMPWTQGDRLGWAICLVIAGTLSAAMALWVPFEDSPGFLDHLWLHYDGPRLWSR